MQRIADLGSAALLEGMGRCGTARNRNLARIETPKQGRHRDTLVQETTKRRSDAGHWRIEEQHVPDRHESLAANTNPRHYFA
jgi:hypothetical protein